MKAWITANFLKTNHDKSEIIGISKRKDILDDVPNLKVGDAIFHNLAQQKIVGVMFDTGQKLDANINVTYKRAFHELYNSTTTE